MVAEGWCNCHLYTYNYTSMHSNKQYTHFIHSYHTCIHVRTHARSCSQWQIVIHLFGGGLSDVWALHCCVDKWFCAYESCVCASGKPYCHMNMNVDSISSSMIYKMRLRDEMEVGVERRQIKRFFRFEKRDTCFQLILPDVSKDTGKQPPHST